MSPTEQKLMMLGVLSQMTDEQKSTINTAADNILWTPPSALSTTRVMKAQKGLTQGSARSAEPQGQLTPVPRDHLTSMNDTDYTRTSIGVPEIRALADALDMPHTDPTKVARAALERLTHLNLVRPLTLEQWLEMGKKFINADRA